MPEALLVIDMLNDFVLPDAPLEVPNTRKIVAAIRRRIDLARAKGCPVIYVCDAHLPDDPEFTRINWPPHAIRGSAGAQVITELAPAGTDPVVEKTGYSGFHQTGMEGLLQALRVDRLILTGCVTNICVLYTAYDAVSRGYEVTVPADCVAALADDDGKFALKQMEEVLGVEVLRP